MKGMTATTSGTSRKKGTIIQRVRKQVKDPRTQRYDEYN